MRQNFWRFAVLICLSVVGSIAQAVTPVSYNANFQAYGNNVPVQFRAWIPDGYERIKGLIVSLPGSRGDHRGIVSNTQWQFRLSQMGYGIVGFRDLLDYGADLLGRRCEQSAGESATGVEFRCEFVWPS